MYNTVQNQMANSVGVFQTHWKELNALSAFVFTEVAFQLSGYFTFIL